MAIAYAYNNYLNYSDDPNVMYGLYGQKEPYLAGRKNIKLYSAVPHKAVNGTTINSNYGDSPVISRFVGHGNGGNQVELSDETIEELMSRQPGDSVNIFGSPNYPVIYHPSYKKGYGPIDIKIVDPLNVVPTEYALWMDDFQTRYITNVSGESVQGDSASKTVFNWYLKDLKSGEIFKSDTTSESQTEKLFLERGISVVMQQPWTIGPIKVGDKVDSNNGDLIAVYTILAQNNAYITSSVTYADSSNRWLSGIKDEDAIVSSPLNWIRSGNYGDQDEAMNNDYGVKSGANEKGSKPYDPDENYEKIADGTWAPYILCNVSGNSGTYNPGPVYHGNSRVDSLFRKLGSIDIVLTSDKSKWTRCPVVEMCLDSKLAEGNAPKFTLRRAPSVDKDGNPCASMDMEPSDNPDDPNYIAAQGMGWFPGYAIDIESGARLNLIFGEDSFYPELNGRDMLFNPPALKESTVLGNTSQLYDPAIFDADGTAVFGGKHYVYVFPMSDLGEKVGINFKSPAYDAGRYLYNTMKAIDESGGYTTVLRVLFWSQPLWCGMPMAVEGREWLQPGNPVKISIRVATPYKPGYAPTTLDSVYEGLYDTIDHVGYNPYFTFSTVGLGPTNDNLEKAETDLDLITVVPNPYYAYSTYEPNALTHRVKIANVPDKCVVTIYTMDGVKVRQFKKDDSSVTSIDWDLTNFANTPIASGLYIIHVKDNVNGGEKVVKFYCAMRQVDLNTF